MVKTKSKITVPKLPKQPEIPKTPKAPKITTKSKKKMVEIFSDIVAAVSDLAPMSSQPKIQASDVTPPKLTITSDIAEETVTVFQALRANKNFPIMAISLVCSFLVSATFYWAGRMLMKVKFEDMFQEKLPRYQSLVYGMGAVQNIDVDRILLQDDLNEHYFTQVDGSITLDMPRILEENRLIQSLTDQRTIAPEELLSKGDLDEAIFDIQTQTGHVTVDMEKVIEVNNLVCSTGFIQHVNIDNLLTRDDLAPHAMATALGKVEDLSLIDEDFAEGGIIFDADAAKRFAPLFKRKSKLSPMKPIVIDVRDDCDLAILGLFIRKFNNNVILDLSNSTKNPADFEQFTTPVMRSAMVVG